MSTPMSTPYTPMDGEHGGRMLYEYDDDHGQGLVTFAGIMLMIAAVLNMLYGIAAIDQANFLTQNARYVFGDLNTWGWFVVALGVGQFFAAIAIYGLVAYGGRRRAANEARARAAG